MNVPRETSGLRSDRGIVVHPTGNRNVREALRVYSEGEILEAFFTCVDGQKLARGFGWLGGSFRDECLRRSFPDVESSRIFARPWRELARLGLQRLGSVGAGFPRAVSVDAIYREVDERAAKYVRGMRNPPAFVHAYEDGALECFRAAGERGSLRVYDLPIAYFETGYRLLSEEAERLPDWATTLGIERDPPEKLERKREELRQADVVLCASGFVLDSLPAEARAAKRCCVPLFGCDLKEGDIDAAPPGTGPLKVLFVGRMTQRKGLGDLFEAMRLLGNPASIELHLLGPMEAPRSFYEAQGVKFVYHTPRARGEVLAMMASCHVFVLPSIVEGRALVQLEALAQGTPLLVTRNAGGEDLVEEGCTGWLVPIRSPSVLAERLEVLARDVAGAMAMREACRRKAATVTWAHYRKMLIEAVRGTETA